MAHFPTPILVVSASINRGELFHTYEALAAGAVDVLDKPSLREAEGLDDRFRAAVRIVSKVKVITHPRARIRELPHSTVPRITSSRPPTPSTTPFLARSDVVDRHTYAAIAIGTSTGGPGALVQILRALPAPFPIPILVVLHLGEPFGIGFAEWLDGQTPHRTSFATSGEPLASLAGRVVMAAPDRHLALHGGALQLGRGPALHSCRPSVDVLFHSMATELGPSAAACLLTGMGRDGAQGLLDIRRAGGLTLAQDEASSVVYGMPREAARLDAAERVLPLDAMAPALAMLARRSA